MTTAVSFRRFASILGIGFAFLPTAARAEVVPPLDHVIVVVMENKNPEDVNDASFISGLVRSGATFSDYRAIAHPSQPNYVALWSGGTQGIDSNRCPATSSPLMTPNLGTLSEGAGLTWRAYAENLPATGSEECFADGKRYSRKHAPWTNFGNIDHRNERPYAELAADIAAGRLPRLAFVIPNNSNNMHDGSVAQGDDWLARNLPGMIEAVGPNGIVVLTWDENRSGSENRILTVVSGPRVKRGFVSDRPVNHYTMLRTLCDGLALPPPGAAAAERPMLDIWVNPAGDPKAEQEPGATRSTGS